MKQISNYSCQIGTKFPILHANSPRLEDTIRAARELGIRFHPTRGAMSHGASKGGLPPDDVCEEEAAILADMRSLIETYHDNSRRALCHCHLFRV
jgi:cytosine/adenosine deaminase-related metal-dependent hydrolase